MQQLKTKIENHQIYIYFAAILLGVIVGLTLDYTSTLLESLIPIFIGILMLSMFSQIPFLTYVKTF
ncbi:hypothetical protein [Staphylococcus shinii]|uniref:hypothetical protein n=1 Tax=Staphylococcus shinii TaxID=2912228 RepID=UPI00298F2434|nr:hypothetical protein [Staphylococcus shinii]MDW8573582.1 hypothetical protein [Staphylococcus shinii]